MNWFGRWTAIAAVMLVVSACGEDKPSGPGNLLVTVSGTTPLGAVVINFAGTGVEGATMGSDGWISHTPQTTGLAVVAISRDGGTLQFELQVADIGAALPVATVSQATTADDRRLAITSGLTVEITR